MMSACENDGDKIYLSSIEGSDLVATQSEIILSQDNATKVVLSLAWTKETLGISDSNMSAPNVLATYVQVSTSNDFSSNVVESVVSELSKAYTGSELNTIAKNMGMDTDIATPVYFRLRSTTGNNISSVYSNIIEVQLTSYYIDMSIGFVLDEDKLDTGVTLASPNLDGIYTGFIGATSWMHIFMLEGDGTIWGNEPQDGTAFYISSADNSWNFWFPEPQGCYYTIVNTVNKTWSALYLPTLTISGDINAEMNYDRPNNRWTYVYNATSAGEITIKLSTTGNQYNVATGDMTSTNAAMTFAQDGNKIVLADQAGDIKVNVTGTGEYTLVLDLSNPNEWTCQAVAGAQEPEEVNPYIYLPGVDDAPSGTNWNFDHFLRVYNEDKLAYAGVVNIHSLWGYSVNIEKDNWGDKYTYVEGDAYQGTITFKGGEDNIPAPADGLYFVDISLSGLTYKLTGIEDKIYLSGLNDVWDFSVALDATSTVGVYSGQITITKTSTHGFSVYLIANNWDIKMGGSEGNLYYPGNNITDDQPLAAGTYTVTVDLINQTYSITQ